MREKNGMRGINGLSGGWLAPVVLLLSLALFFPVSLKAQTELGSEDDLTILGTNGTALDPDTEIKGFAVFGATQASYTGAVVGPGNVVVNGALSVSSGAYFVANSTFTGAGNIFINDGAPGQLLRKNTGGYLEWADVSALGDDLGDHTATTNLDLAQYSAVNIASMTMVGKGLQIGNDLTATANGIFISTAGQIVTIGLGNGTAQPNARGMGAVDLQTSRGNAANVANGNYSVISGGDSNSVSGGVSVVSGGKWNSVSGGFSTIGGGVSNQVAGSNSTVGGGTTNSASGNQATVAGGSSNTAGNTYATVGGGQSNSASSFHTTVGGGQSNTASNSYSVVAGGYGNVASGASSAIPGGNVNKAQGSYSFAAGFASTSTANGTFTWADSQGIGMNNTVEDRTLFKNRGGFIITGSTNSTLTGTLDRGMFISGDGLVGISTGVPYAALDVVSTGTAANVYAQIWRNSSGVEVASLTATGVLHATIVNGDNLGNHTATADLNLMSYQLTGTGAATMSSYTATGIGFIGPQLTLGASPNVAISSEASGGYGAGVRVSTNIYVTGTGVFRPAAGSGVGLSVYGDSGAAKIQEWKNFTGTIQASLSQIGVFTAAEISSAYLGTNASSLIIIGRNERTVIQTNNNNTVVLDVGNARNTVLRPYSAAQNIVLAPDWGSVGIGTTTPLGRLDVVSTGTAANVYAQVWRDSGGTIVGSMSAVGYMQAAKFIGDGTGLTGVPASIDISTINAAATTPYGGVNITTNVFVSGGARIAKYTVQAADSGITLTSADFGKTITINSASAQTINLPSVTSADIGATITVVKLGAGSVTIDAAAATYIADSSSGGTIYNNAVSSAYATLTLRLVTATQWMIVGGEGSWVTT